MLKRVTRDDAHVILLVQIEVIFANYKFLVR